MMRFHWYPRIVWYPTVIAHAEVAPDEVEAVASRDAGWAELWSQDGSQCLGRGHLILWADANHIGEVVDAPVDPAQRNPWVRTPPTSALSCGASRPRERCRPRVSRTS